MTRALIVNDSSDDISVISNFLRARGVEFDVVMLPDKAISYMSNTTYDIIFLDLNLGVSEQDGIGLLGWMDRHQKKYRTIIISRSAHLPPAIRAAQAYQEFVVLSITQDQLHDLADLLDNKILPTSKDRNNKGSISIWTQVMKGFIGISIAALGVWLASLLIQRFPGLPRLAEIAFLVLIFAVILALVTIFSPSIVETAVNVFESIVGFRSTREKEAEKKK